MKISIGQGSQTTKESEMKRRGKKLKSVNLKCGTSSKTRQSYQVTKVGEVDEKKKGRQMTIRNECRVRPSMKRLKAKMSNWCQRH